MDWATQDVINKAQRLRNQLSSLPDYNVTHHCEQEKQRLAYGVLRTGIVVPTNAEIDDNEIVYKNYYNISFAVGTEKGLVVPVLKDADELSFADIEKNIKSISEKARNGKLTIEDLQGGTFTISNGGVYGSMLSTPILNLPQSGVLGMHNIVDRPIVVDGEIKIRPIMYLALSYDHRIVDGKESVSFLKMIKENLEEPRRLFLDI